MDANPHYSMCGTATRIMRQTSDGTVKDDGLARPDVLKAQYDLADFLAGYPDAYIEHDASARFSSSSLMDE